MIDNLILLSVLALVLSFGASIAIKVYAAQTDDAESGDAS
jgi:hypothetical protein